MKIDTQEKLDAVRAKGCTEAQMMDEMIVQNVPTLVGTRSQHGRREYRLAPDGETFVLWRRDDVVEGVAG